MWGWLFTACAVAAPPEGGCARVSIGDIARLPAPAVIVLGERKGHQPDLRRAETIVGKLHRLGKVTLALEAVHRDAQPILDRFAEGGMPASDLPGLLGWDAYWRFPWPPYQGLVGSGAWGVDVIAVGLTPGPSPADAQFPTPPGYVHVLADTMGEHPIPVELESGFVQTVAWRDYALARHAVEGWDGSGWLVLVTDRLHVEGGLGVSWQAQRLTTAPVHAFLLTDAGSRCYAGDQLLR